MPERPDPVLAAATPARRYDEILTYFKEQLRTGTLKAGDRLLPERELAAELGVSRSILREVLRALEILGVLKILPKQGALVLAPNSQFLQKFFGFTLSLNASVSEAIRELRMVIECGAAGLAARRASQEEKAKMRDALVRMPHSPESGDTGADADFEFHAEIVRATHSESLIFVYGAVQELVEKSHQEGRRAVFTIPGKLEELVQEHTDILRAIEQANERQAEDCMRRHLSRYWDGDRTQG